MYNTFSKDNLLKIGENIMKKKLKIINFKEWIVIFWKSDKIFKKNKLRREK